MSNQQTLDNGCVCDSGCDSCDRLAEAFAVMKHGLEAAVASLSNSVRDMQGGIARELNLETVRAALAQAEKVNR